MAKKDATMTLVKDLFVKLANLYEDAYIVKNSFVIAGEHPSERILGPLMCTIESGYRDALKRLVGEKPCFYIANIVETKKWLQEKLEEELEPTETIKDDSVQFIVPKEDKDTIDKCVNTISEFEDRFNPVDLISNDHPVRWWSCLGDNAELIETVFNLKGIFDLPIEIEPTEENAESSNTEESKVENTTTYITIAKQLLPLVTEKNIQNAYVGTTEVRHGDDDELLEVMLDFRFTHFRMMIIYNLVVLPWATIETGSC